MNENICQTCLSVNRRCTPLRRVQYILQEINLNEVLNTYGGVCWECYKIIINFSKFKMQVKLAQDSLKLGVNIKKCFSKLSIHTKNCFDYQFYHNLDPLTSLERSKSENDEVKEEYIDNDTNEDTEDITNEDVYDDKLGFDNCVNVYVDSIELKPNIINTYSSEPCSNENCKIDGDKKAIIFKEKDLKDVTKTNTEKPKYKTKKELIKHDKKVRNKFTKVIFNVKEMLENREQKRNRPNFKKIQFKCDGCLLGFTKKENFDEHWKKKHDESVGAFICDICKVRFPHKAEIEKHCQTHFNLYTCKLCKFESVEMWRIYSHCETRHSADDLDRIHCHQCPAVVKTLEELDKHTTTVHVVYCNECGEKFKMKSTLRRHKVRIHGVKREFVCTICNKTFMKASRLETHVANHNDSLAEQLSYCAVCNIQYKSVQVYRSHLRQSAAHSADKYPCSECNKKFSSKVYLKKHYNFYHLKKSQFKCELCNKLFISDWRLKNHKQKHHGLSRIRNHACNVCGKKFYTQSTLRGHQLTHSEQRTFMCEDCGDTFKQRPALYTHTKLVHKGVKRKK